MAVYAIADLHLSLGTDKPMDVFGKRWEGYVEKLERNWQETVGPADTVIVPGDISWSTYLEECGPDFAFIHRLNGKKVFLKGNHDYWWTTASKLRQYIESEGFDSISFLHNNAYLTEGIAVCGSRGWITPKMEGASAEDVKIYNRELQRVRMSLEDARKNAPEAKRVLFVHYPPFNRKKEIDPNFIALAKEFEVDRIVYGHLHADAHLYAVSGEAEGIEFSLVSADFIDFKPQLLY